MESRFGCYFQHLKKSTLGEKANYSTPSDNQFVFREGYARFGYLHA